MNLTIKANYWGRILCNCLHRKYASKSAKNIIQKDASKHKIKEENAKLIKRFNKENKLFFGSLVETLPQKRKRGKNEPVNEICISSEEDNKLSEAWWWRKTLKANVKSKPTSAPSQVRNCDEANLSKNHLGFLEERKISKSNISVNDTEKSERIINKVEHSDIFHKSSIKLPQIIVKNLPIFPLENKKKQFVNPASSSSSILNIPIKEDDGLARTRSKDYPSVSRILNATLSDSSRAALQKWKENLIADLGLEGFEKYQRALLEHGQMFHKTVQDFLSGESVDDIKIDSAVEGCWLSIQATMKEIGVVKVLESHVVHEELLYHSIIDCVAEYKGKLLLIEWKKSNKQKSTLWNTYDAPLQVAAYVGALNFDTKYDLKVDGGLVVVAYTDGSPAHVHPLNMSLCEKHWQMWLKRLQMYWDLFDKQDATMCQV